MQTILNFLDWTTSDALRCLYIGGPALLLLFGAAFFLIIYCEYLFQNIMHKKDNDNEAWIYNVFPATFMAIFMIMLIVSFYRDFGGFIGIAFFAGLIVLVELICHFEELLDK